MFNKAMSVVTHLYTNNEANKIHNGIVNETAQQFTGHNISYPDKDNPEIKNPDINIDDRLYIEVKVLNPTQDDWQAEQTAIDQFEKDRFTATSVKLNPKPIQDAVYNANNQLSNINGYRLLILFSPMKWQLSPNKIFYMLTGLVTYEINLSDGSEKRVTNRTVPIKQFIKNIDGILYFNPEIKRNGVIWMLNNKTCDLLDILSTESVDFWDSKRRN